MEVVKGRMEGERSQKTGLPAHLLNTLYTMRAAFLLCVSFSLSRSMSVDRSHLLRKMEE
jgi:hypothetical protein